MTKHQIKINNDNELFIITNISLQNTAFIISIIVIILTIAIISTILMSIVTEKKHKKPLILFDFDFQALKDLITFVNHTSYRNKPKRFKHFFFFSSSTN